MRLENLLARLFEAGQQTENLNQRVVVVSESNDIATEEIEEPIADVRIEANQIVLVINL